MIVLIGKSDKISRLPADILDHNTSQNLLWNSNRDSQKAINNWFHI